MPDLFKFKNYGTFTGPSKGNFKFDDSEPKWNQEEPTDASFNLNDIGVLFYQSESNYSYFHAKGSDVRNITLESNAGNLASLTCRVSQSSFQGDVRIQGNILCTGSATISGRVRVGQITSPTISQLQAQIGSKKSFDIPHPSKNGYRLRYICVEGPEAEVYLRGKLSGNNIIELPDYWKDLVDVETIGATLTPIGSYQELFIEKIEWGTKIIVKNNLGGPVNCSYVVFGERKDVQKNIAEYPGLTPADYPGDNNEYIINQGSQWSI
jgi:hypothetical protein